MARAIKLIDAPIGLFEVDGILVLKTEYSTRHENGTITPDCYIIESGEYFWGGVDSVEERNNLEVAPVDMPTLTPPNEWVSVEERLPTDERPVLVFVGYADTMTGFITTSSYFCFDVNPHWQWDGLVRDEQRTLFWMPLPTPPGKDNNVPTKAPNEPLTLEQLREMDGEPVWVVYDQDAAKTTPGFDPLALWALVEVTKGSVFLTNNLGGRTAYADDQDLEWAGITVYRRPPEGEEDT